MQEPEGGDIILLPGLGADGRMFAAQKERFPRLFTPRWLDPEPGETLPEYAARLAGVLPKRPAVLGGASFGGMVAQELVRHLEPGCVVLIGSATPRCIPRSLRPLGRLSGRLPSRVFDELLRASPLATRPMGLVGDDDSRELFMRMLKDTSPQFVRWAIGAVAGWREMRVDDVPLLRIHGRSDRVLPPPADGIHHLVDKGGHLISMTHPDEVNGFLADALRAFSAGG